MDIRIYIYICTVSDIMTAHFTGSHAVYQGACQFKYYSFYTILAQSFRKLWHYFAFFHSLL